MAQEKDGVFTTDEKNTIKTGRDLPDGDGTVSDEQMQAVSGENDDRPTGQDHSTENHAETMPEDGVGAIQDDNDTSSDVARISD